MKPEILIIKNPDKLDKARLRRGVINLEVSYVGQNSYDYLFYFLFKYKPSFNDVTWTVQIEKKMYQILHLTDIEKYVKLNLVNNKNEYYEMRMHLDKFKYPDNVFYDIYHKILELQNG